MNSPSGALVWELWRRNRWGFVILGLLLGVCAVLGEQARRLERRAEVLQGHDPNRLIIPADRWLSGSAMGLVPQTVRLTLGPKVFYEGPIDPSQSVLVEGLFATVPEVRVTLQTAVKGRSAIEQRDVVLAQERLRSRVLGWSVAGGPAQSVSLNFDPGHPAEVAWAQATAENWREAGLGWSAALLCFSMLILLAIFGAAEPHPRLGFTGIPPRRFTLPVPTGILVVWPVVLGAVATCLFVLVWSGIVAHGLLPAGARLSCWFYTGLLMDGMILFQALVWGLPSFPKTRAWLLTLLVLTLLTAGFLPPIYGSGDNLANWAQVQPWVLVGLTVIWFVGAGATFLAVTMERRGAWSGWSRGSAWSRALQRVLPRPLDFKSPIQAQFWMEWRRNGRLALGIWATVLCVLVGFDLLIDRLFGNGDFLVMGAVAAAVWCGIAGLNLGRDGASGKLPMSSFVAVRPITSGGLFQAKLMAGGTLWAGAMGLLGIAWLLNLSRSSNGVSAPDLFEPAVVVAVISLHLFVGILPFCLLGRMPGFPWSLLPWLLGYGILVNVAVWFGQHLDHGDPSYAQILLALVVILCVVKVVAAFWGFRRALKLRISSPCFVGGYVGIWLIVTMLLVRLAWHVLDRAAWNEETMFLVPAVFLLLPLARVALSPLALAVNRHR